MHGLINVWKQRKYLDTWTAEIGNDLPLIAWSSWLIFVSFCDPVHFSKRNACKNNSRFKTIVSVPCMLLHDAEFLRVEQICLQNSKTSGDEAYRCNMALANGNISYFLPDNKGRLKICFARGCGKKYEKLRIWNWLFMYYCNKIKKICTILSVTEDN